MVGSTYAMDDSLSVNSGKLLMSEGQVVVQVFAMFLARLPAL
jgi:hypothetical protein